MKRTLISARGTVEFIVYSLGDDPNPDILIDGPSQWSRPVVGLVEKAWRNDEDGPLGDLPYEPVVVDECGLLYPVYDYCDSVMGGLHWDHCTHFISRTSMVPSVMHPVFANSSDIQPAERHGVKHTGAQQKAQRKGTHHEDKRVRQPPTGVQIH